MHMLRTLTIPKWYLKWFLCNLLDIDECAEGTDDCDDDTRAVCTNTNGSYTCTCKSGFSGSGASGTCKGLGNSFNFSLLLCTTVFFLKQCLWVSKWKYSENLIGVLEDHNAFNTLIYRKKTHPTRKWYYLNLRSENFKFLFKWTKKLIHL